MTSAVAAAANLLSQRYLRDYPLEVAKRLEKMPLQNAVDVLKNQSVEDSEPAFRLIAPDLGALIVRELPAKASTALLERLSPNASISLLAHFDEAERDELLQSIQPSIRAELLELMVYPDDSAGRLMETRIGLFRPNTTAGEALSRLRASRIRLPTLFVVDDDNVLIGRIALADLAVSDLEAALQTLMEPVTVSVQATAPREEVVELLQESQQPNVPVVDLDGRLVGVVRSSSLVAAVEATAVSSIQTMVGASKDERALSKISFAVRKRQPWLQINLLTAFLAAAVVGLFEATIASVTALAVLLPVVAGQSGNSGAQALAVTMRGLALREITVRHWYKVMQKEVGVGLVNGVAIALTCGLGVLLWSGSLGLVVVIAVSMVLAMVTAGFAGALIPIALKRLGQDPAQSSSIILTTVTDVAGFFAFLGIATLLIETL